MKLFDAPPGVSAATVIAPPAPVALIVVPVPIVALLVICW